MNNLTLRRKLMLALSSLALLVLLTAAIGMGAQQRSHAAITHLAQGVMQRSEHANSLIDAVNARAVAARNLVLARDDADRAAERRRVDEAQARLDAALRALAAASAEARDDDPEGLRLVEAVQQVETRYGPVAAAIVKAAVAGQNEAAVQQMLQECRPLLAELLTAAGAYLAHNVTLTHERVAAAGAAATQAAWGLGAVAALATTVSLVLSIVVPRSVLRTLGTEPAVLAQAADRIRDGDLGPVSGAGQAPAGSVLASMGLMRDQLERVVAQVRSGSEGVAAASTQIAQGNQDLSSRTEQQASALQQTSATMEQLGSQVRQNAENASQADQLAQEASNLALQGGDVVRQVVQTMQGIEAGSRRIGDIIGVIDGIAFQTNILALNAAVEAARAGEQGRGFAVVAGEVRTLAQRSAEAAREIKALVGDNVSRVEQGSHFVGQAGQTMEGLVTAVRRVADIMGELRSASVEQHAGVSQVGQAVSQLDQTTQQNAALVEESAAAAENLSQQAHRLVQSVAVFRLSA